MSKNILLLFLISFIAVKSANLGICNLKGTKGFETIYGVITLSQDSDTSVTVVTGVVYGLAANTAHGFHIHQQGDVSTDTGSGAGGHWNPFPQNHSGLSNPNRHSGDLGNYTVDQNGIATFNMNSSLVTLSGNVSAIGKSIILHASFDDGVTQPTGNSGARWAQCVIGVKNQPPNLASNQLGSFASCELSATAAYGAVKGRVLFTQNGDGTVTLAASICGLNASQQYGFHIHEFGDLTGTDITQLSGVHYNPYNNPHAYSTFANRHVGDLGNFTIGANGIGYQVWTLNLISLTGPFSVIGRSVILHIGADDGVSQPSGNSGTKIGACAIGMVDTLPLGTVPCNATVNGVVSPKISPKISPRSSKTNGGIRFELGFLFILTIISLLL